MTQKALCIFPHNSHFYIEQVEDSRKALRLFLRILLSTQILICIAEKC